MGVSEEKYSIWIKSGLVIYAIFCLLIFLYLRFPYDMISPKIESFLSEYIGVGISIDSLKPILPIGVSMGGVEIDKSLVFNKIVLRPELLGLIRGKLDISVNALSGQGKIDGFFKTSIRSLGETIAVGGNIDNIDISGFVKTFLGLDNAKGHVTGGLEFEGLPKSLYKGDGKIGLIFKDGAFPVSIPMLPFNVISFSTLNIDAHMKKGLLSIDKASMEGPDLSGTIKGRVMLSKNLFSSRLNLRGEMTLPDSIMAVLPEHSRLKQGKIKFTLGGRLNLPKFRVITK
ncbi:MAG: type II secretion system protein GspN [Thermodesulfobacteriota bacterium]|nr:type II secretion system protein GspN [Thermodesulfobacteriota bacterium]